MTLKFQSPKSSIPKSLLKTTVHSAQSKSIMNDLTSLII